MSLIVTWVCKSYVASLIVHISRIYENKQMLQPVVVVIKFKSVNYIFFPSFILVNWKVNQICLYFDQGIA